MKRITFIFLIGILFYTTGQAQNKKEIRFEKEFQKTLALVNRDQFTIKFYIATPTVQTLFTPPGAGANIDINPKNCYLSINDSLVTTQLPYFGRATWTFTLRFNFFQHGIIQPHGKNLPRRKKESYRLSNNRSLQPRYLLFEHRYSI